MARPVKTIPISITIDLTLNELLEELSESSGIPKSKIINDIVKERLSMADLLNATDH